MRIGIDARWIRHEASGIGTYTTALIEHLARIEQADHAFVLFFRHRDLLERTRREAGLEGHPRVEATLVPHGALTPLSQISFPRALRRNRIDVLHSTNFMIPLLPGKTPCIATIHDVIPMLFPGSAPESKKARLAPIYDGLMRQVGKRADRILTDSDASRQDILRCLRIPASDEAKVRIVSCGVGSEFRPGAARSHSPERSRSVLYVGRADPHKNLAGLVRAFAQARPLLPFDAKLSIVGPEDDRFPEPIALARELGIQDAVSWTGHLDQPALVEAYRRADVLCLPSRYEGFGLPIVEAMAVGTPVVCSNAGALPEVAGDAAIQFAPDDLDALGAALVRVLTDDAVAADLVERGYAQAARFSWARAAEQTMALYAELAPGRESTSS